MAKELKRIQLDETTDLVRIVEQVYKDHGPRLIQRGDEPLAVIVNPDDYADAVALPKRRAHKDRLMALVGAWSDLDADEMIAELYERRNPLPGPPLDV